ncbi:hypothetical protein GCM10009679_41890 [Saccharothrix algeriensis]|uniref:Uncharacterized protein n=1 Tax=Catellatospora bangladeshensis TaxID=310355 RepID=A0A8J3NKU2_9ACTN|nr:hypothetical protein Cba03nite_47170 [Catellatospora bangladeshensis]
MVFPAAGPTERTRPVTSRETVPESGAGSAVAGAGATRPADTSAEERRMVSRLAAEHRSAVKKNPRVVR